MRNSNFNICVLDGYTMNPGDLSWNDMEALGNLTVYERTKPEEIIERTAEADAVLVNKVVLKEEHFAQLPRLKYVGVLATGYNNIDLEAARRHGIVVTNIPSYSTDSVAQMVFAHILNIYNNVGGHSLSVRSGDWSNCKDFTYQVTPQFELSGKTMGIVALGHTGMATAKIALAFGLKVIAYTSKKNLPEGIKSVSLDELFKEADIVSLNCPLTDTTLGLINAQRIAMMKKNAIIINTGRGPLVNEQDLADALNSGRILAAGIDVLSVEPARADNPLLKAKNCFITPHIAWATFEARQRLMAIAVFNVKQFIGGGNIDNRIC